MRFPRSKGIVPFATWCSQAPRSAAEQRQFWDLLAALHSIVPDAPICAEDRVTLAAMKPRQTGERDDD